MKTTAAKDAQFEAMIKALRSAMRDAGTNPNRLAKDLGRDGSYIYNLLSGKKRSIAAGDMAELERVVGLPPGGLSAFLAPHLRSPAVEQKAPGLARRIPAPAAELVDRLVPVFGKVNALTMGIVMSTVVDRVPVPPEVAQAADLFACYMPDDTMQPRFLPGEVLLINPHKPLSPGCYCFVQIKAGEDAEGFVRQFVSRGTDGVTTRTLNPTKTLVVKAKDIVSIARIVASREA